MAAGPGPSQESGASLRSPMWITVQALEQSAFIFPGALAGSQTASGVVRTQIGIQMGCWHVCGNSMNHAIMLPLHFFLLKKDHKRACYDGVGSIVTGIFLPHSKCLTWSASSFAFFSCTWEGTR